MQNWILHPTKPITWWTQVEERMSARHTSRIGPEIEYFGPNIQIFLRRSPLNYDYSMQNLILYPTKSTRNPSQIEEQISARHISIPGSKIEYFAINFHIFLSWSPQTMIVRCRIKFYMQQRSMERMSARNTRIPW
jgi:hypothetical protein